MNKILKFLRPIQHEGDAMFNLQSRMLNYSLVVLFFYIVVLAVYQAASGGIPLRVFIFDMMMFPVLIVSEYFYKKQQIERSALLLIFAGFVINTVIIFEMGTIYCPATPIYILLVLFAGLFLGSRGVLVTTIASSLTVYLLMIVDLKTNWMPDVESLSASPFPTWATYSLVFVICGLLFEGTILRLNRSLTELQKETKEREELAAQQKKLLSAVDQMRNAILLMDNEGNIEYLNPQYARETGLNPKDTIGKNIGEITNQIVSPDLEQVMDTLRGGNTFVAETVTELPDGSKAYHETSISPIEGVDGEPGGFLEFVVDETEKMRNTLVQQTVFSIMEAAQRVSKLNDLYPIIHQQLNQIMDASNFYIALYNEAAELIYFSYLADMLDDEVPAPFKPTTSLTARILFSGRSLLLNETELEDSGSLLVGSEPKSWLGVPLSIEGKAIGVMAVQNYTKSFAYTETDQKILEFVSNAVAIAIHKTRVIEELAESNLRLNQMANNVTEAFWIRSWEDEQVIYLNTAIEKIFDLKLTEVVNAEEYILRHILPEYTAEHQRLQAQQKGGLPTHFVFRYRFVDGSLHWIAENSFPVFDEAGRHIRTTGYSRDITEETEYQERLRTMNDELESRVAERTLELEKASRMKDEFLASMSHELRTPLTGILGLAEALQYKTYGELSEKQLYVLKNIELSGRHLLDLINDILDVSKIEADKLEINLVDCAANDLCVASLQLTKGMAHQKKINVEYKINPPSLILKADPRRVKQMIVNLLSNAIKFTPDAGKIGLDVVGDEEAQCAHFTIWDTGIGISPEGQAKLFKPFVQLDASLSRQQSGSGLGLVLVSHLAQLHGGSVRLQSEEGKGSRFTITLPWGAQPTGAAKPADEPEQPGAGVTKSSFTVGQKTRLLLVDDNPIITDTLGDFLTANGFAVSVAKQATDALTAFERSRPQVVISDIQMPGMNGLQLISRIREIEAPEGERVPIIALTALAMPGDEERCLAAGADLYLAKPIALKSLLQSINGFLQP